MIHIRLDYYNTALKENVTLFEYDFTNEQDVFDDILVPYFNHETFLFSGCQISMTQKPQIRVFKTEYNIDRMIEIIKSNIPRNIVMGVSRSDVLARTQYSMEITRSILKDAQKQSMQKNHKNDSELEVVVSQTINKRNIFIVHGHNETIRIAVEAFVRSIGYEPIVLFKEPNKGQTIIEKIESNAEAVCYAIVLYTACDEGKAKEEIDYKPRARQNVVFEHGYMCSKLGRDHVVALTEKGVEQPGDLNGVVYVEFDEVGAWQVKIAKEMQAIGLNVELGKIKL